MSTHELAQLNIGIIKGPMDSPVMADFAANLERINAVAEAAPGFVWRLQTDEGDATGIRPFENENTLVNMSVWKDLDSLRRYVYHSVHVDVMRRRREWFEEMGEASSFCGGCRGGTGLASRKRSPGSISCEPRDRVPRRSHSAVHFRRRARHRTNLRSSWVIAALPRDTQTPLSG